MTQEQEIRALAAKGKEDPDSKEQCKKLLPNFVAWAEDEIAKLEVLDEVEAWEIKHKE